MRRSAHVFAPILASAAVLIGSGCHKAEPDRCVDEKNQLVDPKFCQNLQPGAAIAGNAGNNGGYYGANHFFYPHYYRHYYGGMTGLALGSMVNGGSYTPLTGHSYSTSAGRAASSSGTSRGGFGSSFSGGHSSGSSS